jgi:hypothetical protein
VSDLADEADVEPEKRNAFVNAEAAAAVDARAMREFG